MLPRLELELELEVDLVTVPVPVPVGVLVGVLVALVLQESIIVPLWAAFFLDSPLVFVE